MADLISKLALAANTWTLVTAAAGVTYIKLTKTTNDVKVFLKGVDPADPAPTNDPTDGSADLALNLDTRIYDTTPSRLVKFYAYSVGKATLIGVETGGA